MCRSAKDIAIVGIIPASSTLEHLASQNTRQWHTSFATAGRGQSML